MPHQRGTVAFGPEPARPRLDAQAPTEPRSKSKGERNAQEKDQRGCGTPPSRVSPVEGRGPVLLRRGEGEVAGTVAPEHLVAAVEPDPPAVGACVPEHPGELVALAVPEAKGGSRE